ncbi:MAG TPA: hypothetical protein VGO50_18865 [Pyrinomonadaceae bacterium]|jgi:hypothetical protein|nr:hypothetical protein [Pyrinomonadaceae bacterium]
MSKIETDDHVILVLHTPREKIWGVLREINSAGVYVRGLDLNAFDEFMRAAAANETFYGLGEQFFPMWRIEKVSLDEADGDIPSLHEQLENKTGRILAEF